MRTSVTTFWRDGNSEGHKNVDALIRGFLNDIAKGSLPPGKAIVGRIVVIKQGRRATFTFSSEEVRQDLIV